MNTIERAGRPALRHVEDRNAQVLAGELVPERLSIKLLINRETGEDLVAVATMLADIDAVLERGPQRVVGGALSRRQRPSTTARAHRGKARQRSVAARAVKRTAVGAIETDNQEACGHPIAGNDMHMREGKIRHFSAEDKIASLWKARAAGQYR